MSARSSRRRDTRRLLVVGAALVVVAPGIAYGSTLCPPPVTVTVRTPGATPGPTSTFSEISTHADCAAGLISGGGISQTYGPDITDMTSNGNHINGTEPSSDGTAEFIAAPAGVVATDVTHWMGIGGSGGATEPAFSSTPYAMCFAGNVIDHTQVVMSNVAAASTTVATCPIGTRLLGGGARTTPASSGSMKPIASYPTFKDALHDGGKKAAGEGALNPDSWAAVGFNGGGGGSLNTYAFAICSGSGVNVSGTTVKVHWNEQPSPLTATTSWTMTTGCAAGDGKLIGGGGAISGGGVTTADFSSPGSQGDHLTGSYPSDATGNPVPDATTTAAYWTAVTHTGGAGSNAPTDSDVWALCATGL